jgi:hypothetical protein
VENNPLMADKERMVLFISRYVLGHALLDNGAKGMVLLSKIYISHNAAGIRAFGYYRLH